MIKRKSGNTMKKGIMIQTFGRSFADFLNFTVDPYVCIHPDYAKEPSRINTVSPFSICGKYDESLSKFITCERTNTRVKADIYKDFDRIIKRANCDYFVFDNTSADMFLTEINGQLYSLMGLEKTDFMDAYFNNDVTKARENAVKPRDEGLSDRLRAAYDRFIECVTANYPPEKIILIRHRAQKFGLKGGKIVTVSRNSKADNLINELDDYFSTRVPCHVVDTSNIFVVPNDRNNVDYNDNEIIYRLEREILQCIGKQPQSHILNGTLSVSVQDKTYRCLTDYIIAGGRDKNIIREFLSAQPITADDVLSLLYLSEKNDNDSFFVDLALDSLAELITKNSSSPVFLNTKNTYDKNVSFLRNYEYDKIAVSETFDNRVVIRLTPCDLIVVKNNGFTRFHRNTDSKFNWKKHYNDHFHYSLDNIDHALESWETYFERGRNNCSEPFVLQFTNADEYIDSLYYMDYEEMMANENVCLTLKDKPLNITKNITKIDLGFFFDKQNRIVIHKAGLAESMFYFTYQSIKAYKKDIQNIYFYDFIKSRKPLLLETTSKLMEIIPDEYRSHFLRNRVNNRLLNRFYTVMEQTTVKNHRTLGSFALYQLGLRELIAFMNYRNSKVKLDSDGYLVFECPQYIYRLSDIDLVEKRLATDTDNAVYMFYGYNRTYRDDINEQKKDFETIFVFPPFDAEDKQNTSVAEKMLSTDAITLHVRRGDFFTGDAVKNARRENDYYKLQLERVWRIPGYENKHLFVFSDDLDFCREHYDELGLGIAGDNITFVEGNDHFESYRDMQLMSMSKIIVVSQSGFNQCGALVSRRVEYILGEGTGLFDLFPKGQTLWHRGHPEEKTGYEK
jgi:hypothetical protein